MMLTLLSRRESANIARRFLLSSSSSCQSSLSLNLSSLSSSSSSCSCLSTVCSCSAVTSLSSLSPAYSNVHGLQQKHHFRQSSTFSARQISSPLSNSTIFSHLHLTSLEFSSTNSHLYSTRALSTNSFFRNSRQFSTMAVSFSLLSLPFFSLFLILFLAVSGTKI